MKIIEAGTNPQYDPSLWAGQLVVCQCGFQGITQPGDRVEVLGALRFGITCPYCDRQIDHRIETFETLPPVLPEAEQVPGPVDAVPEETPPVASSKKKNGKAKVFDSA